MSQKTALFTGTIAAQRGERAQPRGPMTVADLVALCWRHRAVFLLAALAAGTAVVLETFRTPPLYQASATLEVDRGRKAVQIQGESQLAGYEHLTAINTERERILSRAVLGRALVESDLLSLPAYANHPEPVAALRGRISFEIIPDSWAFMVSLRDASPEHAERALAAVLDAYLASQLESQRERAHGALQFLSAQVRDARTELIDARREEEAYRKEHNILSHDPDENHISQQLQALNAKRTELEQQLADAKILVEQVETAAGGRPVAEALDDLLRIEAVNRDALVREQVQDLYALQEQRVVLAQKYLPKHPRMIEIHGQLDSKRRQVAEAVEQVIATIANRHRQLQLLHGELARRIADKERELTDYRNHLIALDALREDIETRETMLGRLRTRLEEEEIASRLETQGVVVIDPAKARPHPVNLNYRLWSMLALIAACGAGVAAAFVAELLSRRVRSMGEAQELTGLPVLAQVPLVKRLQPLAEAVEQSSAGFVEAFRQLRVAVGLCHRDRHGCHLVVITSPGPGDGKTTVAARLAASLASGGNKVLLIDADLRRPAVAREFRVDAARGFAQVLAGDNHVPPLPSGVQRLDVLPAGSVDGPRPTASGSFVEASGDAGTTGLHRRKLVPFLERMRRTYDYILVDTPPAGVVADALTVAEAADGILLVVREKATRKPLLLEALNWLAPFHDRLLGLVYNGERAQATATGYYSYAAVRATGATARFRPDATAAVPRGASPAATGRTDSGAEAPAELPSDPASQDFDETDEADDPLAAPRPGAPTGYQPARLRRTGTESLERPEDE